jgi:hypothetical protein
MRIFHGPLQNLHVAQPSYVPAEGAWCLSSGESDCDPRFRRHLFTTNKALQISVARLKRAELIEETYGLRPTVMISLQGENHVERMPARNTSTSLATRLDHITIAKMVVGIWARARPRQSVRRLTAKIDELLVPGNHDPWPQVCDRLNAMLVVCLL